MKINVLSKLIKKRVTFVVISEYRCECLLCKKKQGGDLDRPQPKENNFYMQLKNKNVKDSFETKNQFTFE